MAAISVSAVSDYIQKIIKEDYILRNLTVEGEVSNLSKSGSGHYYFTLKDDRASLNCVAWKYTDIDSKLLKEGLTVQIRGTVTTYAARSSYHMIVHSIEKKDIGALYQALEILKRKLTKEGLFDEEHKKPIPTYPFQIGVVTSEHGAAIRDILHRVSQRFPAADVLLAPAVVQGTAAPDEITAGIRLLDTQDLDVIIIGRGGGSFEELNAFNDEKVVRAIFDCKTPVVSAVGHEVDVLLSDFVADLRAPTPTAAAELVTPEKEHILEILKYSRGQMQTSILEYFSDEKRQMDYFKEQLLFYSPIKQLDEEKRKLDDLCKKMNQSMKEYLNRERDMLDRFGVKLDLLNPSAVLSKGYSILYNKEGKVIRTVRDVKKKDTIYAKMQDGRLGLTVTNKETNEHDKIV